MSSSQDVGLTILFSAKTPIIFNSFTCRLCTRLFDEPLPQHNEVLAQFNGISGQYGIDAYNWSFELMGKTVHLSAVRQKGQWGKLHIVSYFTPLSYLTGHYSVDASIDALISR